MKPVDELLKALSLVRYARTTLEAAEVSCVNDIAAESLAEHVRPAAPSLGLAFNTLIEHGQKHFDATPRESQARLYPAIAIIRVSVIALSENALAGLPDRELYDIMVNWATGALLQAERLLMEAICHMDPTLIPGELVKSNLNPPREGAA